MKGNSKTTTNQTKKQRKWKQKSERNKTNIFTSQTPYSTFGYNKGINQPFQQMERILLESQSQNNLMKNLNK